MTAASFRRFTILLTFLALNLATMGMAVAASTVQQVVSAHASNTATLSFANVNASLGNAVVVLFTVRTGDSLAYSSSTWNGSSTPAAESVASTHDYGMQGFAQAWTGLSGTQTLTVTLSASTGDLEGVALVVSGADMTDVLSDFDFDTEEANGSNPFSVSNTSDSTTDDLVISALRVRVPVASSVAVTPSNGQSFLAGSPLDSANLNAVAFSQKAGIATSTTAGFQFNGSASSGYLAFNAIIKGAVGQGEECGGRIPTHYVTVAGAGTQSGSSWANASTLIQAMAYADDGHIVCIDAGTYTGGVPEEDEIPSWNPARSGSEGNPIVFQARWRATTNGELLRTRLSNGITSGESGNPTFGATGRDWIVWDGVWVDEATSHAKVDGGVGTIWNSTGSQIRHSRISGTPMTTDNNHAAIRVEEAHDCAVHSNWLSDFRGSGPESYDTENYAGITVFEAHNCVMTNNLIENVNTGIFWKQDNQGFGIGGLTARFNHIRNSDRGFRFEEPNDPLFGLSPRNYVEQNLFQNLPGAGIQFVNSGGNSVSPRHATIDNNTFVDTNDALFFGWLPNTALTDVLLRNNLVDGGTLVFNFENDNATIATFRSNGLAASYNSGRGLTRYGRTDTSPYDTASQFHTATSLADGGQLFPGGATIFTDRSGGDFTLAVGSPARTASSTNGPIGCYISGSETIGLDGT